MDKFQEKRIKANIEYYICKFGYSKFGSIFLYILFPLISVILLVGIILIELLISLYKNFTEFFSMLNTWYHGGSKRMQFKCQTRLAELERNQWWKCHS